MAVGVQITFAWIARCGKKHQPRGWQCAMVYAGSGSSVLLRARDWHCVCTSSLVWDFLIFVRALVFGIEYLST